MAKRLTISVLSLLLISTVVGLVYWEGRVSAFPTPGGVQMYNKAKSYSGLNLYNTRQDKRAYLTDMYGRIVHTWTDKRKKGRWHYIEIDKDWNLYAVTKDKNFSKFDKDSSLVWSHRGGFHHDFDMAADGSFYTIERGIERIRHQDIEFPILGDFITLITPLGERKKRISVFDLLRNVIPESRIQFAHEFSNRRPQDQLRSNTPADLTHINTIEIIDQEIEGFCEKGDLLLSSFALNLLVVIDPQTESLRWSWPKVDPNISSWPELRVDSKRWESADSEGWQEGMMFEGPHQPSLLPNGNILVFDNGYASENSRVVEFNPITKETLWQYTGSPSNPFISKIRGGVQRLPNGNTLITSSMERRAFEVTSEGEVVWEFQSSFPANEIDAGEQRGIMYRMQRIDSLNH